MSRCTSTARAAALGTALALCCSVAPAQVPPTAAEIVAYDGLHAAAAAGDVRRVELLLASGADVHVRDAYGRTPLHVAAYAHAPAVFAPLINAGADANALERERYDIVTIAAVANDLPALKAALAAGCSAKNVTSPYNGTALIAAAHLGHADAVRMLIRAGAPLDHVNNLGWTAVIEAIMLGDGGARHLETLQALIDAGANLDIADRAGRTPLMLARDRSYAQMAAVLRHAGGS